MDLGRSKRDAQVPLTCMGRAWQICALALQSWISKILGLGFKRLHSLAPPLQRCRDPASFCIHSVFTDGLPSGLSSYGDLQASCTSPASLGPNNIGPSHSQFKCPIFLPPPQGTISSHSDSVSHLSFTYLTRIYIMPPVCLHLS